jgi:hypothetical protein
VCIAEVPKVYKRKTLVVTKIEDFQFGRISSVEGQGQRQDKWSFGRDLLLH